MDALTLLFGTDDPAKIVAVKTKEKQIRAFSSGTEGIIGLTEEECRKLCKRIGIEYLSGYENRIRQYTITDETCDRYGDIVRAKGAVLDNFSKNPVIQFAHNYEEPPVGTALKTWYDKASSTVKAWAMFYDDRVDSSGRSELIWKFVRANAMRACSIGFMPLEYNVPNNEEERGALGLGKYGVEFTKWDLLEFSPVPVPANPNALQDAFAKAYRKSLLKILDSLELKPKDIDYLHDFKLLDDAVINAYVKSHSLNICPSCANVKPDDNQREILSAIEADPGVAPFLKPYPEEHACRLQSPSKYGEFRRTTRKHDGKTYSIIWGKVKDSDEWEEQAYRYPKSTWKVDDARAHCKDHDGKLFEPAAGEESVKVDYVPITQFYNSTETQTHNVNVDVDLNTESALDQLSTLQTKIDEMKNAIKDIRDQVADLCSTAEKAQAAMRRHAAASVYGSLIDKTLKID